MNKNEKLLEKREEYRKYIDEHVANVQMIERDYLFPILSAYFNYTTYTVDPSKQSELTYAIWNLHNNIIGSHDGSKYSDYEFEAYRKNFYPIDDEEKEENKEAFDEAWKHHYTVNNHHPEHWINELGNLEKMSVEAVLEMICDLSAMSLKFGGNPFDYFKNNFISIIPKNTSFSSDAIEIKLNKELEEKIKESGKKPIHGNSFILIVNIFNILNKDEGFRNLFKDEDKKEENKNV